MRGQLNIRPFIYERLVTNICDWSLGYSFIYKVDYFLSHHTFPFCYAVASSPLPLPLPCPPFLLPSCHLPLPPSRRTEEGGRSFALPPPFWDILIKSIFFSIFAPLSVSPHPFSFSVRPYFWHNREALALP